MEKDWESFGAGKIIRKQDYKAERINVFSQIDKIQKFDERIKYLESYIVSFINTHKDVKDCIRDRLFWYYYPNLFFIVNDKKPRIDKSLQQKYEIEYGKIDSRIEKAGGFFKDYKAKRTDLDRDVPHYRISTSGIDLINDLIDKIELFEKYKNEIEETDFVFSHELPEEMLNNFQILEDNKFITRYKSKPNFKHLRHVIAFFDLCHKIYDIPDYGKLGHKDGKKNKIIAESVFVMKKRPSENTISKTRSEMKPSNKYRQDIIKIFPDLSS